MKAIIDSSKVSAALSKVAPAIKSNPTLPILSCVLLSFTKEGLTIHATDLELSISVTIDASCKTPFDLVIEVKDLHDVVSAVAGPITLDASGKNIVFTSDNSKHSCSKVSDPNTFPATPDFEETSTFEAESDFFSTLKQADAFRDSNEIANVTLEGISISGRENGVYVQACDRFIALSRKFDITPSDKFEAFIPGKMAKAIGSVKSAVITVAENFLKVSALNETFIVRQLEYKFANVDALFPKAFNSNVEVGKDDLYSGIKRVSVSASRATSAISFDFSNKDIKISASDVDYGKEAETIVLAENEKSVDPIIVNSKRLLTVLGAISNETVLMSISGSTRSIFIKPKSDDNTILLLQPIAPLN